MTKQTLTLTFPELQSLDHWLRTIIHKVPRDNSSLYVQMQLEILAEWWDSKIFPKTNVDRGRPVKLKMSRPQVLAYQLAIMSGWLSYCPDMYTQAVLRGISMQQLPKTAVKTPAALRAPDMWEEE